MRLHLLAERQRLAGRCERGPLGGGRPRDVRHRPLVGILQAGQPGSPSQVSKAGCNSPRRRQPVQLERTWRNSGARRPAHLQVPPLVPKRRRWWQQLHGAPCRKVSCRVAGRDGAQVLQRLLLHLNQAWHPDEVCPVRPFPCKAIRRHCRLLRTRDTLLKQDFRTTEAPASHHAGSRAQLDRRRTSAADRSPTMLISMLSGRSCPMMLSRIFSSVSASISSTVGSRKRLRRAPQLARLPHMPRCLQSAVAAVLLVNAGAAPESSHICQAACEVQQLQSCW